MILIGLNMQEDFPTSLNISNNYNEIFDIELLNNEEKILYYTNLLKSAKTEKQTETIKQLLNKIMEEDYD